MAPRRSASRHVRAGGSPPDARRRSQLPPGKVQSPSLRGLYQPLSSQPHWTAPLPETSLAAKLLCLHKPTISPEWTTRCRDERQSPVGLFDFGESASAIVDNITTHC